MTGVGVRFAGGPADGQESFIPEDPMNPPEAYEILAASHHHDIRKFTYLREVNQSEDGPLWVYRYNGEAE